MKARRSIEASGSWNLFGFYRGVMSCSESDDCLTLGGGGGGGVVFFF